MKQAMATTPVLALPNFTHPFAIEKDVCDTKVSAGLSKMVLGVRNQKLSTCKKEFLAMMMAIEKW